MLSNFDQKTLGMLSGFVGFTCFASADACAKWLGAYYETFDVIFWTYLISLIFGLIFSPWLGGLRRTLKTAKLPVHIGRGVFALGIAGCVVKAMHLGLPLANMYTILFLAPFLITIAAWPIYKEPVPFKNWLIIALGFTGIIVAYPPGVSAIAEAEIYAFIALGFIIGLSILARPLTHAESLHSLSFYPAVVTLLLCGPFVLDDIAKPALEHLPVFIMNGVFVTVGLSGIAYGFRIAPYSIVAPIHYTQMVIALIAGYLIFGDVPTFGMMAGAGIIIFSGLLLVWSKSDNQKP